MAEDAIDVAHRELAIRTEQGETSPLAPTGLFNTDNPKEVIQKAVAVADALMEIVKAKHWAKPIQGRDHLQIEAWQTIAAMLGVSTECEWTKQTETGWEARVVVRNARGMVIAAAENQCTRDERTWKSRDDYALRSMAQTRATSKALRMALGFIANIAGFDATPSEEMPEYRPAASPPSATASASPDGGKTQPSDPQGGGSLFEQGAPPARTIITPAHRAKLNGLEDRILKGTGKPYEETVALIVAKAQKHFGDPETGKTADLFEGEQFEWTEMMMRKAADQYEAE